MRLGNRGRDEPTVRALSAEVARQLQFLRQRSRCRRPAGTLLPEMGNWTQSTMRLTSCPACGYDIDSLPPRHRCPECGFVYDERMFLLEGWRLPGRRTWLRATVIYGPIAVIAMGVLRHEFGLSRRVLLVIVAIAAMVLTLAYLVAWRRGGRTGRRALARWLITEDGVARPGRRAVYLWRNYSHVMLIPAGSGWRLHLYPSWWRVPGPPMVNARLACSESDAVAVRDEIQRRINAARHAEADSRPLFSPSLFSPTA